MFQYTVLDLHTYTAPLRSRAIRCLVSHFPIPLEKNPARMGFCGLHTKKKKTITGRNKRIIRFGGVLDPSSIPVPQNFQSFPASSYGGLPNITCWQKFSQACNAPPKQRDGFPGCLAIWCAYGVPSLTPHQSESTMEHGGNIINIRSVTCPVISSMFKLGTGVYQESGWITGNSNCWSGCIFHAWRQRRRLRLSQALGSCDSCGSTLRSHLE